MTGRARAGEAPAAPCGECRGTGFVTGDRDGYSFAVRCRCRAPRTARNVATIPPRFREARFETFAERTPSLKRAKATVMQFATAYPAVEGGLFLVGPEGVGKTHLAAALLGALAEKGFPGLYVDFGSLLAELRGTFDRQSGLSSHDVLDPLMSAALLVIDGVGDETPTDWVNDTLARIINHRYNQRMVTVATSRFLDGRTLGEQEGRRRNADGRPPRVLLEERVGSALLSRFYEMCQFVPMDAEDFRACIKTAAFRR